MYHFFRGIMAKVQPEVVAHLDRLARADLDVVHAERNRVGVVFREDDDTVDVEIEDPVLGRKISYGYSVNTLPVIT